jgi:Zn-dependent peptidase ImmA (M78 family)
MKSDQDTEADLFARCLIMPRSLLTEDVRKIGAIDLCDDEQVRPLAKKYGVGIAMMAARLVELELVKP